MKSMISHFDGFICAIISILTIMNTDMEKRATCMLQNYFRIEIFSNYKSPTKQVLPLKLVNWCCLSSTKEFLFYFTSLVR